MMKAAGRAEPSSVGSKGLLQRKCTECKKKRYLLAESRNFGPVEGIQRMPAISQPGDEFEREADRIAEAVVSGRPGQIHPMLRAPAQVQRADEEKDPKKDEEKQKEALKKTGEALLKTEAGKQIIGIAESAAKNATAKPAGKIIAGAVAASAVAAIYAANITLPVQLPEIPLDFLYQGMKVKLTYEGPAQSPSAASISITFSERLPSASAPRAAESGVKTGRSAGSPRSEPVSVSPSGEVVDAVGRRLKTPAMMAEEWARENEEMMKNIPSRGYQLLPPQRNLMPRVWPDFRYDPSRPPGVTGLYPGSYTIRPGALRAPKIDDQAKRKDEDIAVQRKEMDDGQIVDVPPIIHEVLRSPGYSLDNSARMYFEQHLGHDFSNIRVHTDQRAAESARALHAFAYTAGNDIVFNEGTYNPNDDKGRRLIAHELVHSLQQSGALEQASKLEIAPSNDPKENEAENLAIAAVSGHFPEVAQRTETRIQCKPEGGGFKKDQVVALKLRILRMAQDLGGTIGGSITAAVLKKGDLLKLGELHPNGGGKVFYATVAQSSDEKYNGKIGVVRTEWIQATDSPEQSPLPPPTTYCDIETVGRTMADYVDNRYYAVGLAMDYSGYVLYFSGIDIPVFIPSSYVDLSLTQANAREDKIYNSRDEALAALDQSARTSYAFYTGARGLIAPTVFSPASTPRIAEGIRDWYKSLGEDSTALVVTASVIAGTLIAIRIFSRLAGAIKSAKEKLPSNRAKAAQQRAFEQEAEAAGREFGEASRSPSKGMEGASRLPMVDPNAIPRIWRVTQLPLSGGNHIYLYRGFASKAASKTATVVPEGAIGGLLSRRLDAAHDAIFNQVGRDPVLSGTEAGGVVRVKISPKDWDDLVRTNSISERGNYPGFSNQINSTEIRVNSPEASRVINNSPKDVIPPDTRYDFRPRSNRPSGPQESIISPAESPRDVGERETLPP